MLTRQEIAVMLGEMPEPAEARPVIGDAQKHKEGALYTISYNVEPDERVLAYLLMPEGEGPFPAMVFCHQHGDDYEWGKSKPAGIRPGPQAEFANKLCAKASPYWRRII